MYSNGKHVCMLPPGATCEYSTPTAGWCRLLTCKLRTILLACSWHHGSVLFIRSTKSLHLEQHRQMQSARWFIWHPYSPIKIYWDCFALAINFASFLYMPVQVFYPCSNPYDPFILFSDCIAFLEICVCFVTGRAVEDGRRIILDLKMIAIRYIRGRFLFDVIGALPLQIIQVYENCQYPSHTVMYLFKLFRLLSMRLAWNSFYQQFKLSYALSVAWTQTFKAMLFFHWLTYFHFQVPALCAHLYPIAGPMHKWLQMVKVTMPVTPLDKYVTNLYFVLGLCIGAGMHNPVVEHAIPELLLTSAVGIIGLLFVTSSFTALLRLVVYKHYDKYLYDGRLKELQEYLVFKRLPRSLQTKIQLFINYKFNGHFFNETSILNTVNEQIKQEINMFCCKRLVINVPLFQDLPIALVNMIIFSLKQLLYMPGESVVKCGHPGSSIYLIASGTVAVINASGREVAHLKDGAFFGEKSLINPGTPRSATIIALEITEIYKLTNQQFSACLQLCPRMLRRLVWRGRHGASPPRPDRAAERSPYNGY